jgi:TetR/AcrR family transcriptional regulator
MSDSKEKIIDTAIEVFAEKGKFGARMEEIAALAGVNKAMVYYYFSTKENLYKEVIQKIQAAHFTFVANKIEYISAHYTSPKDKLVECIKAHFEAVSKNTNYTKILIGALVNNPEYIHQATENLLKESHAKLHKSLDTILKEGIDAKLFRNVDPLQTQISIMGINLIFFIGKPIGTALLDCPCEDEGKFLEQRINSVIDLVLNGIMCREQEKK